MFCKNCGNQLGEGASFCAKCGTEIKGVKHEELFGEKTDVSTYTSDSGINYTESINTENADLSDTNSNEPQTSADGRPSSSDQSQNKKKFFWIIMIILVIAIGSIIYPMVAPSKEQLSQADFIEVDGTIYLLEDYESGRIPISLMETEEFQAEAAHGNWGFYALYPDQYYDKKGWDFPQDVWLRLFGADHTNDDSNYTKEIGRGIKVPYSEYLKWYLDDTGWYSKNKYIQMVQAARPGTSKTPINTSKSFGKVFEVFFDSPEWEYLGSVKVPYTQTDISDPSFKHVVRFSGMVFSNGEKIPVQISFEVHPDSYYPHKVEVLSGLINNELLYRDDICEVIKEIFESASPNSADNPPYTDSAGDNFNGSPNYVSDEVETSANSELKADSPDTSFSAKDSDSTDAVIMTKFLYITAKIAAEIIKDAGGECEYLATEVAVMEYHIDGNNSIYLIPDRTPYDYTTPGYELITSISVLPHETTADIMINNDLSIYMTMNDLLELKDAGVFYEGDFELTSDGGIIGAMIYNGYKIIYQWWDSIPNYSSDYPDIIIVELLD